MSSQNTFGKVKLNDKVESRVRGDLYARFGGECLETYHCNKWQGAGCLAYGQIASAKIPLSRMISPQLYWIMSGDDFTLDINNPQEPKVLCIGNNPDRQNIYSAALGLYNSRIVRLINKKANSNPALSSTSFRRSTFAAWITLLPRPEAIKSLCASDCKTFRSLPAITGTKSPKSFKIPSEIFSVDRS